MPSAHTFTIPAIQELLTSEMTGGLWVDPFAGFNSPCAESNDLNPAAPTKYHEDARTFLRRFDIIEGLIFDPPYSPRQVSEHYKAAGLVPTRETTQLARLTSQCKTLAAERMRSGSKAICFGWNSNGMGKRRGFKLRKVVIVAHGAGHNDTIITVEIKK